MKNVYLETYSVRDLMKQDFKGTLKKIAEIGYVGVEFAGYGGYSAADLKAYLKEIGLDPISSHVGYDKLEENIPYLVELGARFMICPGAPFENEAECKKVAREFNRIGKLCNAAGLRFGYHNHTREFQTDAGRYLLEIVMENTDPDLVMFQIDVGWATKAGVDVPAFFRKHADRIELLHIKEADDTPMGTGIIDWKNIHKIAEEIGVKGYIVEREHDYKGGDILGCVREDLEALADV